MIQVVQHNQISALLVMLSTKDVFRGREVSVTAIATGNGFSGGGEFFRGHPGPRPSFFCLLSSLDTAHLLSVCTGGGDPAVP